MNSSERPRQAAVVKGVDDAFWAWMIEHEVSFPELIATAIRQAFTEWLDRNQAVVLAAIRDRQGQEPPVREDGPPPPLRGMDARTRIRRTGRRAGLADGDPIVEQAIEAHLAGRIVDVDSAQEWVRERVRWERAQHTEEEA